MNEKTIRPAGETNLAGRRKAMNITQSDLARMCGVSRQFMSMLEMGRVQPNVQVALRLASVLGTTVEKLFATDADESVEFEVVCSKENMPAGSRVMVAKVHEVWVAHPSDTSDSIGGGFNSADGVLVRAGANPIVSCAQSLRELEGNIIVAGCDPALRLLSDAKLDAPGRSIWVNCGSGRAMRLLAEGHVHVAGLHYGFDGGDENLRVVKKLFPGNEMFVMRFSSWEQGWLLSGRVPEHFSGAGDIVTHGLRIANREQGAAVRQWLDEELARLSIAPRSVGGYDTIHYSHTEAVDSILAGRADLMIGPCVMAGVFGLRFIPIGRVAFDLVFHKALFDHPRMDACLKWLSSKRFQQEISTLPGYYVQ
jgi:molybdate-binding protein/DNA-binding XRE family transcriptional regulator